MSLLMNLVVNAWRAAVMLSCLTATGADSDEQRALLSYFFSIPPAERKRALLIGIRTCEDTNFSELPAAHRDVEKMHKLLLEVYGYTEDEITIILDDGNEGHVQPTRVNILAAIAKFVEDVKPGDRLFFHYCGHSTQVENRTNSEEDGMDECLVPLDGEVNKIVDNELHKVLVQPLPTGACLVAVLDTCHSGSLLDLKHYRCNRVFVPWKWRGKRNSEEIRNRIVRRDAARWESTSLSSTKGVGTAGPAGSRTQPRRRARVFSMLSDTSTFPSSSRAPSPAPSFSASRGEAAHVQTIAGAAAILHDADAGPSCSASGESIARRQMSTSMSNESEHERYESPVPSMPSSRTVSRAPSPAQGGSPRAPFGSLPLTRGRTVSLSTAAHGKENAAQLLLPKSTWIFEERERRSSSPLSQFPCNGFCRTMVDVEDEEDPKHVKADVISLASCRDSQEAYEVDGKSMTSHLVDLLRENSNRTLENIMLTISHDMYSMALKRHTTAKEYKRNKKMYIFNITKRIARLELRRSTRTKSSSTSDAPRAAACPSSSRAGRGCYKGSSPLCRASAYPPRKSSSLLLKLKANLKEALQPKCEHDVDMDNFQNPELSSPRPLVMTRPWRM